jgi:hypothetical protein
VTPLRAASVLNVPDQTTLKERINMTTRKRMLVTIICALALLANVVGAFAQEKTTKTETKFVTVQVPPGQVATEGFVQGDNTFVFVSSEMSIDGKLVKGAPYSAQSVNESVQTLAGGNRIAHQNTSLVYRDGEGRTRREQTIGVVGGYAAAGEPTQKIFINDPVAGVNYVLDAKSRTARKMDLHKMGVGAKAWVIEGGDSKAAEAANAADRAQKVAAEMTVQMARGSGSGIGTGGGAGGFTIWTTDSKNTKKESLGKQTIEGVEAEGTRFTTTIAAGEIGNEQPIEMIFESWYSADLQTVIMSKHSDPRTGENTFRLTNINRTEPAHSLFEVPSDYTVQEAPTQPARYKIESGARRPGSEN